MFRFTPAAVQVVASVVRDTVPGRSPAERQVTAPRGPRSRDR